MCTVTIFPQPQGYRLAMNRDEQLSRIAGLPPEIFSLGNAKVIHPREPQGGTWISVNDQGVTMALINWYSIQDRAPSPAASRGEVVLAVRKAASAEEAAAILSELPLRQMNPFRLIGVFPDRQGIHQWQWNRKKLVELDHDWKPQQWISSGFDEPNAQEVRSAAFRTALKEVGAGDASWMRALHASHLPERGPFATCMHRSDAASVSYTEIQVNDRAALMHYCPGAPCCGVRRMATPLVLDLALSVR